MPSWVCLKDLNVKRFSLSLEFVQQTALSSAVGAWRTGVCLLAALGALTASAQDAAWPQRPVKIVVPYAAGGSSDSLGRLISVGLTESLKQPFVIENKGGAGGMIGSQQVSKSAPDGYNLVISGVASHVIGPSENPKTYDPIKDFTHIAMLGGPPIVLAVNAQLPITDLKSFMAYAKANPVSWGSPGKGTHGYLIGEAFEVMSKTPMQHVAYKGGSPAVADTIAGHIPALFTTLSTASAQIQAGKLRALAITSSKRMPEFPNVPTFAEQGYPKLVALTWFSLSGPPGMPAPVVDKLNKEVRKIMQSQAAKDMLAKSSMETFDWDSARFTQFVGEELKQWAPMIKTVKPEN
ncbi:Tripartite tricarboxylate transporter family receptor [Limnohabitans sp. 103DPR2]|nr:Tripartite tricarboxylate transporter family receptor [Limnohabitans sp. 103DPR2]